MKRSELTSTGESYRVLNTRETEMIMTDEDEVVRHMREGYDTEDEEYNFDKSDIDEVEIFTDRQGQFYAILEPFTDSHGCHNENHYKRCENPTDAYDGSFLYLEQHWNIFEDEDEESGLC